MELLEVTLVIVIGEMVAAVVVITETLVAEADSSEDVSLLNKKPFELTSTTRNGEEEESFQHFESTIHSFILNLLLQNTAILSYSILKIIKLELRTTTFNRRIIF